MKIESMMMILDLSKRQ